MKKPGAIFPRGVSFGYVWNVNGKGSGPIAVVQGNALRPEGMPLSVIKVRKQGTEAAKRRKPPAGRHRGSLEYRHTIIPRSGNGNGQDASGHPGRGHRLSAAA